MDKNFYITTTLPYSNADPHIGTAFEFVLADVIARHRRKKIGSDNVFFNIGTDEHGLKMYTNAQKNGQTPQEYVDFFAARWKEFCEMYNISYDNFYRTSSESHHAAAQKFWRKSAETGDIYKKEYSGLYCVGCESFKTEKELVDGNCPDHGVPPIEFKEENYFFRLSKYRQVLKDYYANHPEVVKPAHKLTELLNWIEDMEDISISRLKENLPWGIEVPDDPEQVFYVWFDALTNYVNVVGFGADEKRLEDWWPGVQLFGPDNLRFQAAIWQGMLASVGLPFTADLLCHGMILANDGTKMSKTKGNVVSPFDQVQKFGAEAVRFYMCAGLATYSDAAYIESDLVSMYNSWLADNFGNLLNRVIHLSNNKQVNLDSGKVETEFKTNVDNYVESIDKLFNQFEIQQAFQQINKLSDFGNKYIDEQKPWDKSKPSDEVEQTLHNLSYLLENLIDVYEPVIPDSAAKARSALQSQEKIILFAKLEL